MASPVLQFKRGLLANLPGLQAGEPAFTTDSFDLFVGLTSETNTNKFFGSHRYWTKETSSTGSGLNLVEGTTNGSHYITIKSPDALAGIVTYILPGTQGATSSVLTNDGSGNLTWASGSANPVFSGIATFSDTTNNTLGDANTGAVQIDGGLGVNKNVTIGAGLSVAGESYFIGTATFYGGQINLGDSDTDDIVVAGEFKSNLIPSDDATYNLGTSGKRWNNASFAGIGTFSTALVADNVRLGIGGNGVVDTSSGPLYLDSAEGNTIVNDKLNVLGDLDVSGNVFIGGTTITLRGEDVYIENKDIVLGYTTSVTPNDTTANHAGVAIASTEGTPLVPFAATGINTLPDTYKQLMWFKSGTLGFSTDVFAFNYGVAIGTTNVANGVRLAVGSGITMSDTGISATNFYGSLTGNVTGNASSADQVKTVTASNTNATYHITFVDANNGSATNETVYTDDGIYYNPGTNTFTTQYGYFTANVTVDGTITGTATTATRATLIDTTGTSDNATYYATFVDTSGGQTSETLRTGTALSLNASTGNVKSSGDLQAGSGYLGSANGTRGLYIYDTSGDVSFQGKAIVNEIRSSTDSNTTITLSGLDVTLARNVIISGITTIGTGVGITQFSSSLVGSANSTSSVPTSSAIIEYVRNSDFGLIGDSGSGSINMDHSLSILGTASEIETSVSGQTVTIGLPDNVIVGAALTVTGALDVNGGGTIDNIQIGVTGDNEIDTTSGNLTIDSAGGTVTIDDELIVSGDVRINGNDIKSSDGTTAITLSSANVTVAGDITVGGNDLKASDGTTALTLVNTTGAVTTASDLTVGGNLYVSGNTTQVNTSSLTVEDRTIDLGVVNGSAPSSATTWDLGVLFNYHSGGSAKKSAVVWEHTDTRFKFASVLSADTNGSDNDTPQLSVTTFAPIEIGSLWVTDCAGTSQVISCTGSTRNLENITIDAGTF
jgi:hypothetical protein